MGVDCSTPISSFQIVAENIEPEILTRIGHFLEEMAKDKMATLVLVTPISANLSPITASNYLDGIKERLEALRDWVVYLEEANNKGNFVQQHYPRVN